MQSARTLFLVRALKPKQPLLAVEATGISVERSVGGNYTMARHDDRNRVASDRSPHRARRYNGRFISRHTMSSRNTLGDLAIRSDLATRDREQLKPNLTLKRRANQMQRRRKPRLLPRKISIQPSPRTLKHRRSRTMGRIRRRHATNTRNRIGTYDMLRILFKQRRAKMLLPLKPKPRQTAAISGKQDFAQRRSKRRRDHQRLLSKLRNIIPRIVQTTPIAPKVTQGSRHTAPQPPHDPAVTPGSKRERAAAAGRAPQPPKAAGAKRQGRRQGQGPQQPRAPTSAQRPQPTTAPSQTARSSATAGGGRA